MIVGLFAIVFAIGDTTCRSLMPTASTPVALSCVAADPATAAMAVPDSVRDVAGAAQVRVQLPRLDLLASAPALRVPADTGRNKRTLVAYSDWYGRRLTIHRTLSWAMLPLFGAAYYTGERLLRDGRQASPEWVRTTHPLAAGATAGVFGINTVTGLWNLWDARHDPEGRTRRIIHSLMFVAADAGFAYAGSIGEDARNDGRIRSRHRTIALSSMGVSTASWIYMLLTK